MCSGGKNICGASSTDGTDINKLLFGVSTQRADDELGTAGIQKQGTVTSGKNPTRTNGTGTGFIDEPIVIAQYTKHGIYHRFYWVQSATDDDEIVPAPTLPDDHALIDDGVGSDGGLKIAQLSFEDDIVPTTTPTTSTTGKNCANMKWDPRGYIFDAKTLNPVKDVTVTLYEKLTDNTYNKVENGIGLINPYTTTAESGQFNFFVSPGLYKMTIGQENATIADKSSINPSYQELFLGDDGKTNIYEKDTDVEEIAGRVAVAHIPVQIQDKNLIIDTLQLIVKDAVVGINNQTKKSQMHITGTVSHPKSIVTITLTAVDGMGKLTTLNPIVTSASDLGEYDIYIDQEHVTVENKPLYLQNINVRLELHPFYQAQSDTPKPPITYDIQPIPLYVEGIAYDDNGAPIPNAVVGIYPFFSLNPMHIVIADENGRFRIGSDHVPQVDYVLKYKTPTGQVVIVEPEVFVRQNSQLFSQERINPFNSAKLSDDEERTMQNLVDKNVSEKDLNTLAYTTKQKSQQSFRNTRSDNKKMSINIPQEGLPASNPFLILGAIILIIVLVVGLSYLAIHIKQKNTQSNP